MTVSNSRMEQFINELCERYSPKNNEGNSYFEYIEGYFFDSNFIYYLDLVPSFRFADQVSKPCFECDIFNWIHELKKNTEIYLDDLNSNSENEPFQYGWNFGIPDNLFFRDPILFKRAIELILSNIPGVRPNDSESGKKIKNEVIQKLIEERLFDLDHLIGLFYYEWGFVEQINKEYQQMLPQLIITSGKYERSSDFFDGIEQYFWDKYGEEDNEILYSYPDEYFERRSDYLDTIHKYFVPIIADPDFTDNHFGDSQVRLATYYLFADRLMDPKNKSDRIKEFEKIVQHYITTSTINIYPNGIEIRSKLNNEIIDINMLSSGEKKIILLLSIACFMDDFTFLIDEPELSLSIVWQKSIIKDMIEFGRIKDLTVSTQSPFLAMDDEVQQYLRYLPQEEYDEQLSVSGNGPSQ